MKILSIAVLFLATACVASSQATKTHLFESMKALNFLVGKWQGKVRYESAPNPGQEVFWSANVYYNIGGSMLLIDERGSEMENRNNTTKEVFVVVHWDSVAKEYSARIFSSSKGKVSSTDLKGYVQNDVLVLQTKEGSPVRRYTVKINDKGQWYEVGQTSDGSGDSWKRSFEMTLNRKD